MPEVSKHPATSLSKQAAEWVIRLSDEQTTHAQRADFEHWLAQDIRHREAYEQASRIWLSVTPQASKSHNQARSILGMLLLLSCLYWLPLSEWMADERTDVGEMRRIALPDGSSIMLDSNSAVDIDFNTHSRRIVLHRGRVLAEVAQDSGENIRPFIIENRDGTVKALGTQYVVEQAGHDSVVNVIESDVAVASRYQPDQAIILHGGQSVRFDNLEISQPETTPAHAISWIQARLIYQDVSLNQVISDLARYYKGFISVRDEVDQLRFSGVLPADDPGTALHILEDALPIKIKQPTSWLILINSEL
ncbi:MAG TPA: FecR domain-containing protein [Nitrosomonas halophila]|nr:FecR domain-containing protein [Nitrosomonas halophila]